MDWCNAFGGAIIGAIFSAICTLGIEKYMYKKEQRERESHAASILLYDLKSIEDYLSKERSSVNMRYSYEWQNMVANCSFLSDNHIKCIYEIYDMAHNYNYHYNLKESHGESVRKEDISHYQKLREILFDKSRGFVNEKEHASEYEELLKELKKHIIGS